MFNRIHLITKIFIVVICIALLLFLFVIYNQHSRLADINDNIKEERSVKNGINKSIHALNTTNISYMYDKSHPNLFISERQSSDRIIKGLNLAYNHTKYTDSFNKNKPTINKLLGQALSVRIDNVVKPISSQMLHKATSPVHKILQSYISYGQYNAANNTLPTSIVIKYQTPRYDAYAGEGGGHKPDVKSHIGYTTIKCEVSTKTNTVDYVDSCYNQVIN